jgi:ubiquinone/menaquinone biosynthesis C-methylase UbiE
MTDLNVCPPWVLTLSSGLRKKVHNPHRIIGPYLAEGMAAMDVGCGMGYFTIPMAGIVGEKGTVVGVDLQPKMLTALNENASIAGCKNITAHQCGKDSLNIRQWNGTIDFALIFMMLHEVPDAERLIREVHDALAPEGKLLFAEPLLHVGKKKFQQSLSMIQQAGFDMTGAPKISICRAAILQKKHDG